MPVAVQPPTLHIPTIDLSPASGKSDAELAATLLEALNTVGFLHVLNPGPGLTQKDTRDIFQAGTEIFDLPLKVKEAVGFDVDTGAGYTSMLGQTTGAKAQRFRGDIKESFSIGPSTPSSLPTALPNPALVPRIDAFRHACFSCGLRLLDLFTIALKTPDGDPKYFASRHTYGNSESLRMIHYPSFPRASGDDELTGQGKDTKWGELKIGDKDIRAGAHQDFGSATLLFQSPPDETGVSTAVEGLEIFVAREDGPAVAPDDSNRKGWWVPAPSPEDLSTGGSILVNVGASMQIWSGGKFKATWHRVVCPPSPPGSKPGEMLPGRKSVVFFMIPNHDVMLTPIDQSGKPLLAEGCMTSGDFFKMRMRRAYGKDDESAK